MRGFSGRRLPGFRAKWVTGPVRKGQPASGAPADGLASNGAGPKLQISPAASSGIQQSLPSARIMWSQPGRRSSKSNSVPA